MSAGTARYDELMRQSVMFDARLPLRTAYFADAMRRLIFRESIRCRVLR